MTQYQRRPGETLGLNWYIPVPSKRGIRHITADTNFWKTFVHGRLSTPLGDKGCLSLFNAKPVRHRLLAEHLTAEFRVRTSGRGRDVDEWKLRAGRDNHLFDCLVMSAVAASTLGITTAVGSEGTKVPARQRPRRRRKLQVSF